jgi:hypothetical protein
MAAMSTPLIFSLVQAARLYMRVLRIFPNDRDSDSFACSSLPEIVNDSVAYTLRKANWISASASELCSTVKWQGGQSIHRFTVYRFVKRAP